MRARIQAFASTHGRPAAVARDLEELVAGLLGAASATNVTLDGSLALTTSAEDTPAEPAGEPTPVDAIPSRYADLGRIGVGGMGEVRRVRDRELGRLCAYKAIRADLLGRPGVVARFVDEAQIGAQLQHPNIPPVYDGGRLPDGRPWFTMKEVRGRTFGDLVREAHAGEVSETVLRRLCDVLAKVCDAVGYAHGRGVVHRDLKPDNVMVGSHGEVFVLEERGRLPQRGRRGPGRVQPGVARQRLTDPSLDADAAAVLDRLVPTERELTTDVLTDPRWATSASARSGPAAGRGPRGGGARRGHPASSANVRGRVAERATPREPGSPSSDDGGDDGTIGASPLRRPLADADEAP